MQCFLSETYFKLETKESLWRSDRLVPDAKRASFPAAAYLAVFTRPDAKSVAAAMVGGTNSEGERPSTDMGRKSALTPEQWAEVERRHLIGGESVNSLAKEFGVNEGTIRKKINPNSSERGKTGKPLRELAQEKVTAERKLKDISETVSAMPMARQRTFNDLFASLMEISGHAASAGAYGMATAHRLSALAHSEVQKIDDADPLASGEQLRGIAALTALANESSKIGLNLLAANKEMFKGAGDEPPSLEDPNPDV